MVRRAVSRVVVFEKSLGGWVSMGFLGVAAWRGEEGKDLFRWARVVFVFVR